MLKTSVLWCHQWLFIVYVLEKLWHCRTSASHSPSKLSLFLSLSFSFFVAGAKRDKKNLFFPSCFFILCISGSSLVVTLSFTSLCPREKTETTSQSCYLSLTLIFSENEHVTRNANVNVLYIYGTYINVFALSHSLFWHASFQHIVLLV